MKNLVYLFIFLFSFVTIYAQENNNPDFKNMTLEQRREYIRKMPVEQRKKLMEDVAVMMTIRDLQVPEEKQEAFKKLLNEYHTSQKSIKNNFRPNLGKENLSDADAKKTLYQSFDLGQQLLDNRKIYAEKFLKILTPQQVLRLFNQEGRLREKIIEKRKQNGMQNRKTQIK